MQQRSADRMDCLTSRLDTVERQNRRLGSCVLCLAAVMAAGIAMGMKKPQSIDATEFRLVDEQGQLRAVLALQKGEPRLSLADKAGIERAMLSLGEHGPALRLMDYAGHVRVGLGLATDDVPALILVDEQEKARVELSAAPKGPALELLDGAARVRAQITEAKLGFADDNGHAVWSAP